MKKKLKYGCNVISVFLILSLSYNFYQFNKINNYKKELTSSISKNLRNFAGTAGNTYSETICSEQYANIVAAQELYFVLSDNNGIPSE